MTVGRLRAAFSVLKGGEALIGLSETVAVLSLVVAAVALVFNGLGSRRDTQAHLEQQAQWHASVNTTLDNIKATNDRIDRRLEKFEDTVTRLNKDQAALEGRVSRLESRVRDLEAQLRDVNEAVINEVALSESERKRG